MQIQGTVETLHDAVTKSNFTSRKMWVTTDANSQYPQTVEVECGGKNSNLFDNLQKGQEVLLDINLRGRKWEKDGKTSVFNSLSVWKVTSVGNVQQQAAPVSAPVPNGQSQQDASFDPLPF